MVHCPVCRKYWNDETNTNQGLCSLECQEEYRKKEEKKEPEKPQEAQSETDHFWLR